MIRAAGIAYIAANPKPAVLLLRNVKDGMWTTPGGELENGEEPPAAARREAKEELGNPPDGILTLLVRRVKDEVDYTTFVQRVTERFVPAISSTHDAWAWIPLEDLRMLWL